MASTIHALNNTTSIAVPPNNYSAPSVPAATAHVTRCYPLMAAVSNGFLQGDIPLHFGLPLLTLQIALVLLVTRSMAWLFKKIKQPRVLAEIIGGLLLGPTALGRNQVYMASIFPTQSLPMLETIATMGLMFFIFMVGLELDLQALGKTGKKAFLIATVGIAVPFAGAAALATLVQSSVSPGARLGPLIIFTGTPLCISAFSVLVRIMAELQLLSTEIGKLAVPCAAVNDVAVWTLLAVGVAMAGPKHEPLIPLWVLLCGLGFSLIMFTVVRMFMTFIAHKAVKQGEGNDIYVCITLLCVLLAGFSTDAIGVHPLLGPFLLGLVVPKDTSFPKMIVEKIEDFVTGLMMPLFFALSGLKTNLGTLHGLISLGFLSLFFATAALGKITGTFVMARLTGLHTRKALILGFLMNTKGLAVLIVLNIGKDLKALTDETFAILVLTCLLTSFVTFPVVSALCKLPGDDILGADGVTYDEGEEGELEGSHCASCKVDSVVIARSKNSGIVAAGPLRFLACTDNDNQYPAIVNLVEAARGLKKSSSGRLSALKLYTLRLIHLSDRPSALLNMLTQSPTSRTTLHGAPLFFPPSLLLSKVKVKALPTISSSDLADDRLHLDICKHAIAKQASFIILPYHQDSTSAHDDGFSKACLKVLDQAPCSVGILVDKSSMGSSAAIHPSFFSYNVLVLFTGGPDDREALSLALRMADHPGVSLKVVKVTMSQNPLDVDALKTKVNACNVNDNEVIVRIKEKALECPRLVYEEEHLVEGETLAEAVQGIAKRSMGEVNLFIVGRATATTTTPSVARPYIESQHSFPHEESKLGVVGDVLVATEPDCHACILVVQQHKAKRVENSPRPKHIEKKLSPNKLGKPFDPNIP